MASRTTKGTGNSSRTPVDLKIARPMPAAAIPTSAHTIHEGKYDPRMFLDGAPLQPPRLKRTTSKSNSPAYLMVRLQHTCAHPPLIGLFSWYACTSSIAIKCEGPARQSTMPLSGDAGVDPRSSVAVTDRPVAANAAARP